MARLGIRIFCRKIMINKRELLKEKGPLLLACNHPNSFLDSVILDTLFDEPVWSLARGDVFKKPLHIRLLRALYILPVYRTSEGAENLSENYKTFNDCIRIFRQNGIVTIFSEGKCINEWHLRPLKKGTARLAIKAWEEKIPLKVLPVGINYSSFYRFGKNIFIQFGDIATAEQFNLQIPDGLRHQAFNNWLKPQMENLVFEIPKNDLQGQKEKLFIPQPAWKKILLFLPALTGWLLHVPLFGPVKRYVWKRTYMTDHYDSVLVGILFFAYPVYLLILSVITVLVFQSWWGVSVLILLPFTAWAFVQLKPQLDSSHG